MYPPMTLGCNVGCNPCWVQEEQGGKGLQPTYKVEYGDLRAETTEKQTLKMKGVCHKVQAAQLLTVSNDNHQDSQDDKATVVALLKACAKQKDLRTGSEIHMDIIRKGLLEKNVFLGSTLISMYAKCGALEKAQEVFDELSVKNVISWNALITAYAQHGNSKDALTCFEQMRLGGFSPNAFTFTCLLKACGSLRALDKGREIHAEVGRAGILNKDLVVSNALVDMYAKCGALDIAQEVFNELCFRDMISWNALIGGYAQHGHGEEALNCFEWMKKQGFSPDAVTFACILKACGSIGACDRGQEIHADIVRHGMLENGIAVGTALVDMYIKCDALEKAQEAFDVLPARDVVVWNVLIAGYAQHEHGEEALSCFEQMRLEGFSPNAVTFSCILNACGSVGALDKGQEIHAQILQEWLLRKDIVLGTGLIDMYAKCGALVEAREVFDELSVRDIVSWNGLISGYAQHGHGEEALNCFKQMQLEGFTPNVVTFDCILKVCGSIGAAGKGQEIHAQAERRGLLEKDVVANALVNMYAKCGAMKKAQEVFDELHFRDTTSWNALIAGYSQHEHSEEALNCFDQMRLEDVSPNAVTFACALKACGSIGTLYNGQKVHAEIVRFGMLDEGMIIGTALVVMYANCGMLAEAQESFDKLPDRDVVSWSVLMEGYAQLGKDDIVFDLFGKMREEGMEPSPVTFTIILSACSHRGLLGRSQMYLEILSKVYGIIPTLEHHTCIVDLFGRAGCLDMAVAVMKELPVSASLSMWQALLGACRNIGNTKLGRWAFTHAVKSDENNAAAYVSLRNIYAADGWLEHEAI